MLCLFLLGTAQACTDTKWVSLPDEPAPDGAVIGKPGEGETPDPEPEPEVREFINNSYVRGDFFEIGRISAQSLAACNDLIYLAVRPYADGSLAFDIPQNDGTLAGGARYVASFDGRNGLMHFDGAGSMNCGMGLLESPDGASKKFTFATYLYIDEWVKGADIFRKQNGNSTEVALQLGDAEQSLRLVVNGSSASVAARDLKPGTWQYICVVYDNGAAKLFCGSNPVVNFSQLPAQLPNNKVDFVVGDRFKGYLDETCVSALAYNNLGKTPLVFNNWNNSKTLAYWKYDDAQHPAKDAHTWATRLEAIRAALATQPGERMLRIGAAGGEWHAMVADEGARARFASNIARLIEEYHLDGVDLDFEWSYSATEFDNYSKAIIKLNSALDSKACFSVSLHPVSYRISKEAIAAVDYISLQCYGPSTELFSYERFVRDGQAAVAYGIPASKLLMGVPFYGTTGKAGEQVAYCDLINDGGYSSTFADEYDFKGKHYVLNSVETIRKKTRWVCSNNYGGIMSWDLATDVDVNHELSLLKAVKAELDFYGNDSAE